MNAHVETHPALFRGRASNPARYAAEQDVIAGVVRQPERLGTLGLEPKHFHAGPNRDLWEVLLALQAEGEVIDPIAVAERCEAAGKRGHFTYLGTLLSECLDANFDFKAALVFRESQTEHFWRQLEQAMPQRDEAAIVRIAEDIQMRRAAGSKRAVQAPIATAYQSMRDEWEASRQRPKTVWGLRDLDKHVKPMEPTRLHVVMARPGMGKTAFALKVALENAMRGKQVGFISVEQSMEELTARALCMLSRCPMRWINGEETPPASDVRRIDEAKQTLVDLPLIINDATPMTIGQLQGWARSLVHRYERDFLVVDYIQKIEGTARRERHERIAEVVMGLKDIARIHKVPVLALAQAKRDAEGRRPVMSDLRDSGFIEQEADLILALHREQDDDSGRRDDVCEVLVLKNRHGEGDLRIKTVYRGATFRFEDFDYRYAE